MEAEVLTATESVPTVRRFYAFAGVLIALGWPFAMLALRLNSGQLSSVRNDVRTIVVEWAVVAVSAAIAFRLQKVLPEFFRLHRFGWRDALLTFGSLVGALVLSGFVSRLVDAPKFSLSQVASVPLVLRVSLVLTAAICEELIYRGFAIEGLGLLTGNRWIGALVSLIFFGLGHIGVYGFSTALLIPASVGLVITLLYMFRNNLLLCMLLHGAMDSLFLLLIPALLHR